jgi:outer membrane protein OmpA-like peptidoglycan-associated protein
MVGDDGTNLKLSVKGDGSFEQIIKPNVHYAFLGTCKGYLNHREELCVDTVHESKEYTLQFALASITAPVLVPGIFYEFDKADLTPDSKTALDELYKILIENPNITIELSAHCDYRGSDAYNVRLSQRRAESVVKYLIAKGIPAERMTPMGYGKSRPKVIKKKLTETYPFLHENDSLTEAFIKKLNKQQQDTCNALNRRTEFKVLRTTYGLMETLRKEAAAEQKKAEKQEENSGSATKDD